MTLAEGLALNNAVFNTLSATCAVLAYRAIRRRDVDAHRRLMLGAFGASCIFLTTYLLRIAMFGDTRFQGSGAIRIAYFAILVSHVVLAIAVVPLVLRALFLGWKQRFEAHKRVARYAFPLWVYVSVTGVVVYLMLYHWPA